MYILFCKFVVIIIFFQGYIFFFWIIFQVEDLVYVYVDGGEDMEVDCLQQGCEVDEEEDVEG